MRLSLALAYGGRRDIVAAARWLAARVRAGLTLPEEIGESYFGKHLATRKLPPVDVLIRAGARSHSSDSLRRAEPPRPSAARRGGCGATLPQSPPRGDNIDDVRAALLADLSGVGLLRARPLLNNSQ
jgi:hypothetical protein